MLQKILKKIERAININDLKRFISASKEAKDLKLPRNIPLLVETRVIDDEKGNPIEFTKTAYAANRYVVDMRLGLLSTTPEPFKAAPIAPAKTSN